MANYFQKDTECMSREDIKSLQEQRFLSQLNHVWNNVPYYKKKMEDLGLSIDDITGLKDLHKLPFLTKDDLKEAYPFGLFGVPKKDCVRIHSTSGTTGKRVIAGYTQSDLDLWEDCCARAMVAAGASNEDVCQIAFGYGLFTGGMGINGGSHKLGCMTIPMSSGNTERQIQFMIDMGTTFLCCTPSYAAYLAECLEEKNLLDKIQLRSGIFGAEPFTDELRNSLEKTLKIKAYDIYGLTELSGPGVAYECSCQNGLHINEDHFIAEIIDPDTYEVLPYGSKGELVITAITKKAFPLLRYRTKDICILDNSECECGRTFVRMSKPMGRSDDMLIVKGVNVFPSQIETVLMQNNCSSNCQIVIDPVGNSEKITVYVEMPSSGFSGKLSEITKLESKLVRALRDMLGIKVNVRIVSARTIARTDHKAVKVIDNRNK